MATEPSPRELRLAALAWQVEMGVDECMAEAPVNRFEEAAKAAAPRSGARPSAAPDPAAPEPAAPAPRPIGAGEGDSPGAEARRAAAAAETLDDLRMAIASFEGAALKKGARSTVFADGNPAARVMFIGEAPGRDEDREGKPFVGRSGQLLDRMLAAIGLDRRAEDPGRAAYITNILPWRPLDNRDPSGDEVAMLWPFVERHIELARPEFLVALGKSPAAALTERAVRITRERGRWLSPPRALGLPLLLTYHPAYLLRQPAEKARSWRDLLSLRAVMDGAPPPLEDRAEDQP